MARPPRPGFSKKQEQKSLVLVSGSSTDIAAKAGWFERSGFHVEVEFTFS
jgi:hypothetical protein